MTELEAIGTEWRESPIERLRDALRDYWGPDTHLGEVHPETLAAAIGALEAFIKTSQARPAEYANEPWLGMSKWEHIEHAADHIVEVEGCHYSQELEEIEHAITRLAMARYLLRKEGQ